MGRLKKPQELKLLENTYREDRDGSPTLLDTVKAPLLSIEAPKSLKTKRVKEAWNITVTPLCRLGLVSEQDLILLETAFIALGTYYKAQTQLEKAWHDEEISVDKINTYNLITTRSADTFSKILLRFGCSPSDRARLISDCALAKRNVSLAQEMTSDS
jgi:phage terminase small subunit